MRIHTVKKGESIGGIAAEYAIDESVLRRNNGLERGVAAEGEELLVLTPTRTYRVRGGDSAERIAMRFGITVKDIYSRNPFLLEQQMTEGTVLALKYGARTHGMAPANGYVYKGCSKSRLARMMPYLTYVTVASAVADEKGLSELFDGAEFSAMAAEGLRIPLLRVYSRCKESSFEDDGFRNGFGDKIINAALRGGYKGVTLGGCYGRDGGKFIVELRGKMIGCDLILLTEMDENSPASSCDFADGSILTYAKYALDAPPDMKSGELKVYGDFAESAESSKTFVELPSLARRADGFVTIEEARGTARREGATVTTSADTLLSEFIDGEGRLYRYASLKNLKSILDAIYEYGFMGVSFDIMRIPENFLMMYNALFKTSALPSAHSAGGCGG